MINFIINIKKKYPQFYQKKVKPSESLKLETDFDNIYI